MSKETALLLVVAVFAAYPFICGLILRLSRNTRMEFADHAKKLLESSDIESDHKILISYMTEDVFDWRFMARATIAFPMIVFTRSPSKDLTKSDRRFFDNKEVRKLIFLHRRCVMAASPLFTLLFMVVLIVTVSFAQIFLSFYLLIDGWNDTVKQISPEIRSKLGTSTQHAS